MRGNQAESYGPASVYADGKIVGSMIDMQDEAKCRALRRAVGAAFAASTVLQYEAAVDQNLAALRQRLLEQQQQQQQPASSTSLPLYKTLQLSQLDFMLRTTFSEDARNLAAGRDVHDVSRSAMARGMHWARWQPLPALERLVYKHPLWGPRLFRRDLRWLRLGNSLVEKRRSRLAAENKDEEEAPGNIHRF